MSRSASGGQGETHAASAGGFLQALHEVPGVEIDTHAGGGFTLRHIQRDLGGTVCPIAGVGPDALDHAHALEPAGFERQLPGCGIRSVLRRGLHGLLQQGFHHLGHGAALAGIGEIIIGSDRYPFRSDL